VDDPDGVPVPALAAWGGKRVADMTRKELVEALNGIWRAYLAVNQRTMGGELSGLPTGNYEEAYRRLGEWFYGPDATQP